MSGEVSRQQKRETFALRGKKVMEVGCGLDTDFKYRGLGPAQEIHQVPL